MHIFKILTILLLAVYGNAAPTLSGKNGKMNETNELCPSSFIKYEGQHEIVNLVLPLNLLHFNNKDTTKSKDSETRLFFVEADVDANKKRTYKGLYVLKNGVATKILENGRDAAGSADSNPQVFFGAQDGLYEYKADTNEAVKYGSINDSIIGIVKTNVTGDIYILTENNEVYKVTDAGNTKSKVKDVVNAQQIVLDYKNNLYFYSEDNKPYVLTDNEVKEIQGLPANATEVNLIRPPFLYDEGVLCTADNLEYVLYPNGTSNVIGYNQESKPKPTAYAIEGGLVQYYAHNKKIYECNIISMIVDDMLGQLTSYIENKLGHQSTNDI